MSIRFHEYLPIGMFQLYTSGGRVRAVDNWFRAADNWHTANQAHARYMRLRGGVPDKASQELARALNVSAVTLRDGGRYIDQAIARAKAADQWEPSWPRNLNAMLEADALKPERELGGLFSTSIYIIIAGIIALAFVGVYRITIPQIKVAEAKADAIDKASDAIEQRIRETPPGVPVTLPDTVPVPGESEGMGVTDAIVRVGGVMIGLYAMSLLAPIVLGDRRG